LAITGKEDGDKTKKQYVNKLQTIVIICRGNIENQSNGSQE
jgi:hypothetical protein